jgi:hypothetical protein
VNAIDYHKKSIAQRTLLQIAAQRLPQPVKCPLRVAICSNYDNVAPGEAQGTQALKIVLIRFSFNVDH